MEGFLLTVVVTAANVGDRTDAKLLVIALVVDGCALTARLGQAA